MRFDYVQYYDLYRNRVNIQDMLPGSPNNCLYCTECQNECRVLFVAKLIGQ